MPVNLGNFTPTSVLNSQTLSQRTIQTAVSARILSNLIARPFSHCLVLTNEIGSFVHILPPIPTLRCVICLAHFTYTQPSSPYTKRLLSLPPEQVSYLTGDSYEPRIASNHAAHPTQSYIIVFTCIMKLLYLIPLELAAETVFIRTRRDSAVGLSSTAMGLIPPRRQQNDLSSSQH
jgi:hypothetical protein